MAIKIHGNTYNYRLVNYINSHTKIDIICDKHGVYQQKPYKHIAGMGCPKCANESKWVNYDTLLIRLNEIHGNLYKYDRCSYSGTSHNMNIFCCVHEIWF
jgi:hypothetical protein